MDKQNVQLLKLWRSLRSQQQMKGQLRCGYFCYDLKMVFLAVMIFNGLACTSLSAINMLFKMMNRMMNTVELKGKRIEDTTAHLHPMNCAQIIKTHLHSSFTTSIYNI